MSPSLQNVLFICTHNSARSIIAEGMLNALGAGRFRAHSAGSHPATAVHPLALRTLAFEGTDEQKLKVFRDTAMMLRRRIELMLALPMAALDRLSLQHELREIGRR